MNGVKFLLDTNILIGLLNRNEPVIKLLTKKQAETRQCAFSTITRMELLSYQSLTETDRKIIKQLLGRMHYLPITAAIEDATIAFHQKHACKLPDAIIAGTSSNPFRSLARRVTSLGGSPVNSAIARSGRNQTSTCITIERPELDLPPLVSGEHPEEIRP